MKWTMLILLLFGLPATPVVAQKLPENLSITLSSSGRGCCSVTSLSTIREDRRVESSSYGGFPTTRVNVLDLLRLPGQSKRHYAARIKKEERRKERIESRKRKKVSRSEIRRLFDLIVKDSQMNPTASCEGIYISGGGGKTLTISSDSVNISTGYGLGFHCSNGEKPVKVRRFEKIEQEFYRAINQTQSINFNWTDSFSRKLIRFADIGIIPDDFLVVFSTKRGGGGDPATLKTWVDESGAVRIGRNREIYDGNHVPTISLSDLNKKKRRFSRNELRKIMLTIGESGFHGLYSGSPCSSKTNNQGRVLRQIGVRFAGHNHEIEYDTTCFSNEGSFNNRRDKFLRLFGQLELILRDVEKSETAWKKTKELTKIGTKKNQKPT